MSQDCTVLFGYAEEESVIDPSDRVRGGEMIVDTGVEDGDVIPGRYKYESEAMFGSPTTADGRIYFDTETGLIAVTKFYDSPKGTALFMSLSDALGVTVERPPVTASAQHEIYKEHAFGSPVNGYVISFKSKPTSYTEYDSSMGSTVDPEKEAEERAKFSDKRFSNDMVDEIARDAMDDEMYVWSADLVLGDDQHVGFSDPLRFTRVEQDWFDDGGVAELFIIARRAIE